MGGLSDMERAQYLITRNRTTSFYSYLPLKSEHHLAPATTEPEKPRLRVRALLGHCLYRRVVIWTVTILFLLSVTLFRTAVGGSRRLSKVQTPASAADLDEDRPRIFNDGVKADGAGHGEGDQGDDNGLPWLKFPQ